MIQQRGAFRPKIASFHIVCSQNLCMSDDKQQPKEDAVHVGRALFAELLGTFILVFVGAFASVSSAHFSDIGLISKGVAPGLAVMALIYMGGSVSGMHINPGVTTMFALRRAFPWERVPFYWLMQLVGSLIAALVVSSLLGNAKGLGGTYPKVDIWHALGIEFVLSLILYTIIIGTANRARVVGPEAAIAVGGTVALCGLIAEPITGASMNPARSFGPAVVSGRMESLGIYFLAPLLAAITVTLLHPLLFPEKDKDEKKAAQGEN